MSKEKTLKELATVSEIELVYSPAKKLSSLKEVKCSNDIYEILKETWDENKIEFIEQFKVLLLNRANRLLGIVEISRGGSTCTIADPKLVFAAALKSNACSIIISHNHPSGNSKPSAEDKRMTMKIREAANFLEIKLLDHIIVTKEAYYSFADDGAF